MAQAGWSAASVTVPTGAPYSNIAGAILGGLMGGTAGCAVGATLGEAVDDHILDNLHCLACGYGFTQQRP